MRTSPIKTELINKGHMAMLSTRCKDCALESLLIDRISFWIKSRIRAEMARRDSEAASATEVIVVTVDVVTVEIMLPSFVSIN